VVVLFFLEMLYLDKTFVSQDHVFEISITK
jgi:hypothetical protein